MPFIVGPTIETIINSYANSCIKRFVMNEHNLADYTVVVFGAGNTSTLVGSYIDEYTSQILFLSASFFTAVYILSGISKVNPLLLYHKRAVQ